jgi:ABC-type sulfate transport system permease subunit
MMLLLVAGYSNYGNWDTLPSTNTAVKYYYILFLLLAWKIKDHTASNRILVLTLLFLPFAYFNVFAGRSYMLYAVALLGMLHDFGVPRLLRSLLLVVYVADVIVLLFISGHYF